MVFSLFKITLKSVPKIEYDFFCEISTENSSSSRKMFNASFNMFSSPPKLKREATNISPLIPHVPSR